MKILSTTSKRATLTQAEKYVAGLQAQRREPRSVAAWFGVNINVIYKYRKIAQDKGMSGFGLTVEDVKTRSLKK